MTVDCTNIESILGPLRKFVSYDYRMISLRSLGSPFAPLEESAASAALKWTSTSDPPASDWLGNGNVGGSYDETRRQIRIAAFIAFMDMVPVLAEGHPWCLLDHQAAGHRCAHTRFLGRRILLQPAVESRLLEIAKHWYNKQLGCWCDATLSELMEYRAQLQTIGLDCNSSRTYRHLMEAFYPIDLSQAVIDQVSLQPFALESILGDPRRYPYTYHEGILVIIAPNSD
jgi:hypothetical protein